MQRMWGGDDRGQRRWSQRRRRKQATIRVCPQGHARCSFASHWGLSANISDAHVRRDASAAAAAAAVGGFWEAGGRPTVGAQVGRHDGAGSSAPWCGSGAATRSAGPLGAAWRGAPISDAVGECAVGDRPLVGASATGKRRVSAFSPSRWANVRIL